jgi:hypothetical protein
MAKLPSETKATILNMLGQLAELIDEAAATESLIAEQFGETEITISTLDDLLNVRERLRDSYTRLSTIYLNISESQPRASAAMLNLLYQTIENSEAAIAASDATIREAKRDMDLL